MPQKPLGWDPDKVVLTAWPKKPEQTIVRCAYAQRFWVWCERLVDLYLTEIPPGDDGVAQINQALLHLQDGYFDHRAKAPAEHQDNLGNDSDHQCLYVVWREMYERIIHERLRHQPAPLLVKRKPKPALAAGVPDLFLPTDPGGDQGEG